jgi:hypothetical protein
MVYLTNDDIKNCGLTLSNNFFSVSTKSSSSMEQHTVPINHMLAVTEEHSPPAVTEEHSPPAVTEEHSPPAVTEEHLLPDLTEEHSSIWT